MTDHICGINIIDYTKALSYLMRFDQSFIIPDRFNVSTVIVLTLLLLSVYILLFFFLLGFYVRRHAYSVGNQGTSNENIP